MAEAHDTGYLSIGEVLGLLLEDFPDVTISKIRFLESQGLISPERTASGYRKFYDHDVELLRVILTEQRSNYLPLRVIKDRLETGEIDPTGDHQRPDDDDGDGVDRHDHHDDRHHDDRHHDDVDVPTASVAAHPAARHAADDDGRDLDDQLTQKQVAGDHPAPDTAAVAGATNTSPGASGASPRQAKQGTQLMPGVLLDRDELCAMVGMTESELTQLEGFGIVVAREGSVPALYGEDALEVAKPACEFLRAGVDARHLRTWRTSAEREASLYEQLVTPRFRQRNPESHAEALEQLKRLDVLGGDLRAAMTKQALRRHFES